MNKIGNAGGRKKKQRQQLRIEAKSSLIMADNSVRRRQELGCEVFALCSFDIISL